MQTSSQIRHIPGLDSLRGIAVISFVLFHFFPSAFGWGWVGVDLFFVLSGFLITSSLLRSTTDKTVLLTSFYTRRALRILPLSTVLLFVFFLGLNFLDETSRFSFYKENGWYYVLFLQNWLFVFRGFPQEYILNHFWSLAVEVQFYLFFPIAVFLFSKKTLIKLILIAIPIILLLRVVLWYYYSSKLPVYYCNTFTRLDSILFGCLLGCGFRIKGKLFSRLLTLIATSILLFGVIYYQSVSYYNPLLATIGFTLIALLNFQFLGYFIAENTNLLNLRKNIALNFLGKISFGIYLFHLPVYLVIKSLHLKYFGKTDELITGLCGFLITFLLSSLSYYTIETYFLQKKYRVPLYRNRFKTRVTVPLELVENHKS